MREDIWKIGLALAVGTFAGWNVGYPWIGALFASLGVIVWQVMRQRKLYLWVTNPNNHPMHEESGQPYQTFRELSRRARAAKTRKKRLTELVSRFRRAVAVMPDAIVLINQLGEINWANVNAEKMFGIRWPSDAGVRFANLVRDPALTKLLAKSKNQMTLDHPQSPIGIEIRSSHNDEQVLNIKIIPYTDELRMVLARDVTRLVAVNQMHTDFVANVSHELKTPLTVLRGYVEILLGNVNLDDTMRKPLEQMLLQSERMQLIVQDLLFLAKLEEPEDFGNPQTVNMPILISSVVEMLQPKIDRLHHQVQINVDSNLLVMGNQNELHSACTNLVSNAIDYTPEGGKIELDWQANGNQGAIFSVVDNGLGIPEEHISRLTQRFYRIDSDRSREKGGTGLGLAIVKHVLQRHDAHLEIDSVEGDGSRFSCLFPAHRVMRQGESN